MYTYRMQSAALSSFSCLKPAHLRAAGFNLDSVLPGAAPRKAHFGSKTAEKVNSVFDFLYFLELFFPLADHIRHKN